MDINDILDTFIKDVQNNPGYYTTLGVILVFLIMTFILIQVNKRHKPKETDFSQTNRQRTYGPKYAAGGEMDSLRNRSYYYKQSAESGPMPSVILIIALLITIPMIPKILENRKIQELTPENTTAPITLLTPTPVPDMQVQYDVTIEMESAYSADYTQLFITTTYRNNGITTAYNITPIFQIFNHSDEIVQEKEGEYITAIAPQSEITRTIAIDLEIDVTEIKYIRQHIEYNYSRRYR